MSNKTAIGKRRAAARVSGSKTYEGSPCRVCGSLERYVSNGCCVSCVVLRAFAWVKDNPDRQKENNRLSTRRQYWRNPEKFRELARLNSKERRARLDPIKVKAAREKWNAENPDKVRQNRNNQNKHRRIAVPKWLKASGQLKLIRAFYKETGQQGMQVDHDIPIGGCLKCEAKGLHVLANLQAMHPQDNRRKGQLCNRCWQAED